MNDSQLLAHLGRAIKSGACAHAFILSGGSAARRMTFASHAAALLFGDEDGHIAARIKEENCPDLLIVRPDGGSIKTEQIAELSVDLRSKPFSADRTVAIIEEAEAMTLQSQNKLLKTLEEPAAGTVLLLLTENPERLLPTIRSRCVTLRLGRDYGIITDGGECLTDAKTALSIAAQHMKPLADMFAVCDKYAGTKTDATQLLDAMEGFLRDMVVGIRNGALVMNRENAPIAAQLTMSTDATFRRAIALVETARREIDRGMNIKYSLRDMGVRIRQEGLYGKSS